MLRLPSQLGRGGVDGLEGAGVKVGLALGVMGWSSTQDTCRMMRGVHRMVSASSRSGGECPSGGVDRFDWSGGLLGGVGGTCSVGW